MSSFVRGAFVIAIFVTASCSGSGTQDQTGDEGMDLPAVISAEAMLSPSAKFASQPIALNIQGEYANFSKKCSQTKALIGPVAYPRQVVAFDEPGRRRIPTSIEGTDKGCPLQLVSIQVELLAAAGDSLAGGAAFIGTPGRKALLQCFSSVNAPGTCVVVGPQSAKAREARKAMLIGDLVIRWTEAGARPAPDR